MKGAGTSPHLCLQHTIDPRGYWQTQPIGQKCHKNIFGNGRAAAAVVVAVAVAGAGVRVGEASNTTNCSWVNVDVDVDFGHEAMSELLQCQPVRAIKSDSQ